MTQRKHTQSYTAEFRTRGVRLFKENRADYASDNAAYRAIAPKLGCSPDSLRAWCRRAVAILEKSFGREHPNTRTVRANLARMLRESS